MKTTESIAQTFRALSDETRLRILNLLIRTTKISRHLAYLRRSGLVSARRQGLWMLYSIARSLQPRAAAILRLVESLAADLPQAKADNDRLLRNVKEGCCATYSTVIPDQKVVFLKLNKQ
jgi:ArsR family transcriptional regulator